MVRNNSTEIPEQKKSPVEPRMAKQQTRLSPVPTNLNKSPSFTFGPSLSLMHGQLKREAKLSTVIGQ